MYPAITSADLVGIRVAIAKIADQPGWLDEPACPYPQDVKNFLRSITRSDDPEVDDAELAQLFADGEDRFDAMGREIERLYNGLAKLKVKATDSGEQVQIYKAQVTLLEKLLSMQEKTLGLKDMADFKRAVTNILDGMDRDHRTDFLARLDAKLETAA